MGFEKLPYKAFNNNTTNLTEVDFGENGTFKTETAGGMAIHGITNPIKLSVKYN